MKNQVNMRAVETNMMEALRVGKCPWCCDLPTQMYVFEKMNPVHIEYEDGTIQQIVAFPQETFEESQKRWREESIISEEQFRKAMSM